MTRAEHFALLKRAETEEALRPFIEALLTSEKDMAPGATFRAALCDYLAYIAECRKTRH